MRVTTVRDLGNVLRERRQERQLSQGQLALLAGTSRVTVNKVESGHSGAALGTMLRLLGALDLMLNVEPKPGSRLATLLDDYEQDSEPADQDAPAPGGLEV